MMKRRHVLAGLAGGPFVTRLSAQAAPPPVVFYMGMATRLSGARNLAAFRDGMRKLGHVEGQSYALVERYADGDFRRGEAMLREPLPQPVAVYLAPGPASARLVLRHTNSAPIVSVGLHPRGGQTDLFASLARPGGRVTGVSNFGEELAAKRVQLLKEAVPRLGSVAVLHNAAETVYQRWGEETEAEVRAQGLAAQRISLGSVSAETLRRSMHTARAQGVQAVIVVRDFLTTTMYRPIALNGLELGLAIMGEERSLVEAGALMSYGASDREQFGGAASFVDRILKGALPAYLPIEQVARFELVLNLKTAKALGLAMPQLLLLRADEVIE